jgi:hypothetical protein
MTFRKDQTAMYTRRFLSASLAIQPTSLNVAVVVEHTAAVDVVDNL